MDKAACKKKCRRMGSDYTMDGAKTIRTKVGGTTESPTKSWISTVQYALPGSRIDLATEVRP